MMQSNSNQSLYIFPDKVETRWASPENPAGEKVKLAKQMGGEKDHPRSRCQRVQRGFWLKYLAQVEPLEEFG